MKRYLIVAALAGAACTSAGRAQNLDQLLNQVDAKFSRPQVQAGGAPYGPSPTAGAGNVPALIYNNSARALSQQHAPSLFQLLQAANRANGGQSVPAANPFSRKSLLRTFFGAETNYSSAAVGDAGDGSSLSNAQDFLQIARDKTEQAESAASRASCGDSYARQNAAAQAQNYAKAARDAAQRATSFAAGHSEAANDAAAQARNAADRAQSAADRARYNASTAQ